MSAATGFSKGTDLQATLLKPADGIATSTLRRPTVLHAFAHRMELELIEAFDRCDRDDAVRAIVLTGAGDAFCADTNLSRGTQPFADRRSTGGPAGSPAEPFGTPMRRAGGRRVVLRCRDLPDVSTPLPIPSYREPTLSEESQP